MIIEYNIFEEKKITNTMCIKDKKRFGLALLGLCLFIFDIGSDTWVGNKLIQNCHVRFGAGVLCLVYVVPGLGYMINEIMNSDEDDSCIDKFDKLIAFVFFVPLTVIFLFTNLIKLNDESLSDAKVYKFYEVLCEAFPQSILGIYMVLVLQQQEILNWMSISISVVSLIYGVAETVTFNKFNETAPFLKVVLSGLSGIIDTSFRVLFISYFSSLSSPYSLLIIPLIYIP